MSPPWPDLEITVSLSLRRCRQGMLLSLVTPSEAFVMDKLARKLGIAIPEAEVIQGRLRPAGSAPAAVGAQP